MLFQFCLLSVFAFYQEGASSDVSESLEVVYKQVQIRVQDQQSMPIKGLSKADFVFKRNGKVFTPSYFQEVDYYPEGLGPVPVEETMGEVSVGEAGSALEEEYRPESRTISILLDGGIASPPGFEQLKKTVARFVAELEEDATVSLYEMRRQVRVVSPFTENKDQVLVDLNKVVYTPELWTRLNSVQQNIVATIEELENPRVNQVRLPTSAGNMTGGSPAQDTNLVNAELQNQLNHGRYNRLSEQVKLKRGAKNAYMAKVANAVGVLGNSLKRREGDRSVYLFTSGGYIDEQNSSVLKDVTSRLNWENITVHAFHLRDRDTKTLNGVKGGHITESVLRDYDGRLARSGKRANIVGSNDLAEDESALKGAPRSFAYETGGSFVSAFNSQQIDLQLTRFKQGAAHYYLVSYPSNKKMDSFEATVRNKTNDLNIIFGKTRGNYVKRFGRKSKREKRYDFANTILYGLEREELSINWDVKMFRNKDGLYVLPVAGRLATQFPPEGYFVGMVAIDENGDILDDRKSVISKPADGEYMTFYDLLVTDRQPSLVRAMIQEKKSGAINLKEYLIDPVDDTRPELSSLVLVSPERQPVFAIHVLNDAEVALAGGKVARGNLDPLMVAPNQAIPFSTGPFRKGQPIGVYFHAQNLNGSINDYALESYSMKGSKELGLSVQVNQVKTIAENHFSLTAVIDTRTLPAGEYEVGIRLLDKRDGSTTEYQEQEFTISE